MALGLQNEAKVDLEVVDKAIEQRITELTRFDSNQLPPALHVEAEAKDRSINQRTRAVPSLGGGKNEPIA